MSETRQARWGQERRLEFIDFRLYWEGRVNRSDLIDFFGISVPQASLDLTKYQEMAPQNAIYDRTEKAYLVSDSFSPVITAPDANPYLNQLLAVELGVLQIDSTYLGWAPPVAAVKAPSRTLNASDLRLVLKAIKSRRMLQMTYQSMNHPSPTARTVSPHAIGFDGSRWHIRAYCHDRQDYRDFVFARILEITVGDSSSIDPATDSVWQREIEVIIEPHPALSAAQRHAVELDYGMSGGRLLLKTREALLFYLLRHLALLRESDDPAWSNYVVLVNRDALKPFFESHGFFGLETEKDQ
jgi:hypothetical protein